jgi:hypothetical protein
LRKLLNLGSGEEVMDPRTIDALTRAGWSPGRSVGRSTARLLIGLANVTPTDEQVDFVEQFTGLTVNYLRGDWTDSFWIDVGRAVDQSFEEWIADYCERSNDRLIPVGFSGPMLLLLGTDGSLYGGFDDFFVRLGRGPEESLDWIVWRQDERSPED